MLQPDSPHFPALSRQCLLASLSALLPHCDAHTRTQIAQSIDAEDWCETFGKQIIAGECNTVFIVSLVNRLLSLHREDHHDDDDDEGNDHYFYPERARKNMRALRKTLAQDERIYSLPTALFADLLEDALSAHAARDEEH